MLNYPVSGFVHPFCTSPIYSAIIKLGRGNDPIRNQFSILSLFSNNVQGAWYDPSDMTTLFQDAAGTLPVTAVEQPVGLMLDKRDTTYSTYFDGSGDYLGLSTQSVFPTGTQDFSVEFWAYKVGAWSSANRYLFNDAVVNGFQIWVNVGSSVLRLGRYSVAAVLDYSYIGLSVNAWNHFAYSRKGNNFALWVNGVRVATITDMGGFAAVNGTQTVASDSSGSFTWDGYLSNVRIVRGTAVYDPANATLTVPTAPLTAVAGTSLLTCGTTWSGNPAITTVGNTRADKLNPFKIGTGNHAYNQAGSSGSFPRLSALYNLLTKTEDFSDAYWSQTGLALRTVSGAFTTFTENTSSGAHNVVKIAVLTLNPVSTPCTISCVFKAGTRRYVQFQFDNGTQGVGCVVDTGVQPMTISPLVGSGTITSSSIVNLGGGEYQVTVTGYYNSGNGTVNAAIYGLSSSSQNDVSYTGNGSTIICGKIDLRVTNDALNQPAYQRVNTSSDYDTVGFRPYLRFNGFNQSLQTNSIDFNTDKMFVSAGVRKLSDAADGIIVESSTLAATTAGAFLLGAPATLGSFVGYGALFNGTGGTNRSGFGANTYSAPITNVTTASFDYAGATILDEVKLRINGTLDQDVQFGVALANRNFTAQPLFIGARAGSLAWFSGRLYGLVVAGKQASDSEITNTENYLNQKTGAY